jgi:preprotein translocase subunit SecG
MYEILMVVYLVIALGLIGFILVQQGKGAGMGASFGQGASGTVFGAGGSGNFLTKTTTILAVAFFGVALGLGNLTAEQATATDDSIFGDEMPVIPAQDQELPSTQVDNSELPTAAKPEAVKSETAIPDGVKKAAEEAKAKVEAAKKETEEKSGDTDTNP